ncbi:hypothetical protein J3F83DRAFT_208664 [Trichoderma novae-zelandiae]
MQSSPNRRIMSLLLGSAVTFQRDRSSSHLLQRINGHGSLQLQHQINTLNGIEPICEHKRRSRAVQLVGSSWDGEIAQLHLSQLRCSLQQVKSLISIWSAGVRSRWIANRIRRICNNGVLYTIAAHTEYEATPQHGITSHLHVTICLHPRFDNAPDTSREVILSARMQIQSEATVSVPVVSTSPIGPCFFPCARVLNQCWHVQSSSSESQCYLHIGFSAS